MVRSGNRPYRTDAQKFGGGKTRRQQLSEKLAAHRRRLREQGLVELTFSTKPAELGPSRDDDYAIYGIYRDGSDWVLTGMACTDSIEQMSNHRGGGYSETRIRGRYVMISGYYDLVPSDGIEIRRFETKTKAMQYVSAESSERLESGKYLVRASHNPQRRREEVDREDFSAFKREAHQVIKRD